MASARRIAAVKQPNMIAESFLSCFLSIHRHTSSEIIFHIKFSGLYIESLHTSNVDNVAVYEVNKIPIVSRQEPSFPGRSGLKLDVYLLQDNPPREKGHKHAVIITQYHLILLI